MKQSLAETWQTAFLEVVQQQPQAISLKEASLNEQLDLWTKALTAAVVTACELIGWQATAKGHPISLLPVSSKELLSLDVMAFAQDAQRWHFPIAIMELENSPDLNRVAYSLWKVLCVHAALRVVFCYSRTATERTVIIQFLRNEVLQSLAPDERMRIDGHTLIVIGSRDNAATFPFGYFKWWKMDKNTGTFSLI